LTKHQGAGNDFMVLVDPDGVLGREEVRALCDRRLGVGADGVLRVVAPRNGADVGMELRNADGGAAEMSGNGIRCLVQAAVDAGVVGPGAVRVSTDGGLRTVDYRLDGPGRGFASVNMGPVELADDIDVTRLGEQAGGGLVEVDLSGVIRARPASTGNPHLVLWASPIDPDGLARVGPLLSATVPGGANVEFVWPGERPDELVMRVWERGAGLTMACGTGSCAAVAASYSWDEVGTQVVVHNPGGALEVTLHGGVAQLAGPTVKIADITVDRDLLDALSSGKETSGSEASDPGPSPKGEEVAAG
jgi:diaminopimelate epimerase